MGTIVRSVSAAQIFVSDRERARRFYRNVRELDERSADPPHWLVFDVGEVTVVVEACQPDDPESAGLVGRLLALSFDVAGDIDTVYRRLLARGVASAHPTEKREWGGTLAFLSDPDGNVLTLVG